MLRSDWEARVMLVHPSNDFGGYWCPPVHADDCYESVDTLTHLYRYLLLDEAWDPWPDYGRSP